MCRYEWKHLFGTFLYFVCKRFSSNSIKDFKKIARELNKLYHWEEVKQIVDVKYGEIVKSLPTDNDDHKTEKKMFLSF